MLQKEYNARYKLFKRYILRVYLEIDFLLPNSTVIKDLWVTIYFKKDGFVFIAYDIEKVSVHWILKQTCRSIEMDNLWFFHNYTTILSYIRNFNKRKNAN